MRYIKRPDNLSGEAVAARYRAGEPLDDLLRVARRKTFRAAAVEVPQWRVLLVRVPGNGPGYTDYEVVEDGDMLVYSEGYDVLYPTSVQAFEREWVAAEGSET